MANSRLFKIGVVMTLTMALSACAIYDKPHRDLPTRDTITAGQEITVNGNQSVYAIAREHNVSMRDLIVLNGLQPPFALKPGQTITLPASATFGTTDGGAGVTSAGSAAPSNGVERVELAPITPAPVTATPLSAPEPAKAPTAVDKLNEPRPAQAPVATTLQPPAQQQVQTQQAAQQIVPSQPAAQPAPVAQAPTAAAAPTATTSDADDNAAAPEFGWPVEGQILSSFGAKGKGLSNDGVNISAPKGAPIKAAAGGTVVYAGNEMKGFGNLILIRHPGGWVSAYAHLDRMMVNKDSIVAKGDMIGTVGKTGDVKSPQLHFELRHSGKPQDPAGLVK